MDARPQPIAKLGSSAQASKAPKRLARLTVIALIASLPVLGTAAAAADTVRTDRVEELVARAEAEGQIPLVAQIRTPQDGAAVAAVARFNRGTNLRTFEYVPYVTLSGTDRTIRALGRNPLVVGIWEDIPKHLDLDASLPIIGADTVQSLGWTGAGTTVAILDTGIDADHPFFDDNNGGNPGTSRIVSQACFSNSGGGGVSLCQNGMNTDLTSANVDNHAQCTAQVARCDHGTHVAGTAAGDGAGLAGAPGAGVAPDASIIAIQVFTRFNQASQCTPNAAPCLRAFDADQISGLNRVATLASSNPGWNVISVNMSIGGTKGCAGDAEKAAVDALLAAGIVTVTSYGNAGSIIKPGCANTAVTVGSTTSTDQVSDFSNRGPILDLFAPGGNRGDTNPQEFINAPIVNDTYGGKAGTSMATPHVAGAFAVLRQAYPARTIAQLLNDMTSTGVPVTYDIGDDETATTPRLNLLAALQAANTPPSVAVDQPSVQVDEGQIATNTGTVSDPDGDAIVSMSASVGSVVDNGDGTWSWSWQTADGPSDSQTVTITATDDKGEDGSVNFSLVVDNVAPAVSIDPDQVTVIQENEIVAVIAGFSDPGFLDTHTATIDWGVPAGHEGIEIMPPTVAYTDLGGPGPRQGIVAGAYQYGDNDDGSGFTIEVTVTDKDGGVGSDGFSLTVVNVDPTVSLDTSGTVLLNGVPTVVAHAGEDVDLESLTTDPGSDDLTLTWDWDDGTADTRLSLVNDPDTDPLPSPTVQPRHEPDGATHAFGDACLYEVTFSAVDDDGGEGATTVDVIITGNADRARSAGYWGAEYRGLRRSDFTPETLQCYLDIVNHASAVFSEHRPLLTSVDASVVLSGSGPNADDIFDRQLLAAWLNFANGAYDLDQLVDTTGDGTADTAYLDVMIAAETLRTDPSRTRAELIAMKNVLERLNTA